MSARRPATGRQLACSLTAYLLLRNHTCQPSTTPDVSVSPPPPEAPPNSPRSRSPSELAARTCSARMAILRTPPEPATSTLLVLSCTMLAECLAATDELLQPVRSAWAIAALGGAKSYARSRCSPSRGHTIVTRARTSSLDAHTPASQTRGCVLQSGAALCTTSLEHERLVTELKAKMWLRTRQQRSLSWPQPRPAGQHGQRDRYLFRRTPVRVGIRISIGRQQVMQHHRLLTRLGHRLGCA